MFIENLIERRVYMDKELLALLISALSEIEIVELYKVKKVNNFGFRVNTIDEVRTNRKLLEENLLKHINIKRVHDYFALKAKILEINIEGLELNELKELCESEGYTKVLITLYIKENKEDKEDFRKIVSDYLEKINEESIQDENNTDIEESVLENKANKAIKKLEIKLNNITEDFKKKEKNYKSELDRTNKLIIELRKENMRLKQEWNQVNKENDQHKNENANLKNLNDTLQKQNENYSNELKDLEKEVNFLNEYLNLLNGKNQIPDDTNSFEVNEMDKIVPKKIVIIGEFNELISNISGIHFDFIEGKAIEDFTIDDISQGYNEIWIIHYDLTQKEKRVIQMKNLESEFELRIRNIFSLKELNQAIINLKKNR